MVFALWSEVEGWVIGLRLMRQFGYENVDIQSDSLMMVNIVSKKMVPPWNIKKKIMEIWDLQGLIKDIMCAESVIL